MKKLLSICLVACMMLSMSFTTFAQQPEENIEQNIFEQPLQFHPEYGTLKSVEIIDNGDGTYIQECLYEKPSARYTDGATYTKTAKLGTGMTGIVCEYEVSADFVWDKTGKKTYVYNVDGEVIYEADSNVTYGNARTTSSGHGTRKASGTFSFTRYSSIPKNLSVTVSCDYNGNKS